MVNETKWEKAKSGSKKGFDWGWKHLDKLGAPVNKLSNKLGCEAFWPTDLGRESDKAARILRSFCKDGFYAEEERKGSDGVVIKGHQRVLKKIPQKVIQNAKGLCIFTTMRTGLWISGAGGSGVLVARLPDNTWSPPSGVLLHTAGLGFLAGVDIYDCVVVINSEKALAAFENPRFTIGGEFTAVAGPAGIGELLETELHKRQAPVFNYIKSRGLYAGVQIDGTVIIERTDENETFYGQRLSCKEILSGKARHPPYEIKMLMETIKAAQGDSDVDQKALPDDEDLAPGDFQIEDPGAPVFGIPAQEDPDPFGAKALELEGLEIREAGSGTIPSSEQFEFKPSTTSPVFNVYKRNSVSSSISPQRLSNRASTLSRSSVLSQYEHRATQMDDGGPELLSAGNSDTMKSKGLAISMMDNEDEADSGPTTPQMDNVKIVTPNRGPPPALPPRNPVNPSITLDSQPLATHINHEELGHEELGQVNLADAEEGKEVVGSEETGSPDRQEPLHTSASQDQIETKQEISDKQEISNEHETEPDSVRPQSVPGSFD